MATLNSFEDLECWKSTRILTRMIYQFFAGSRDFGFREQIQRASVSIMNNLAEGFGRIGTKEKLQFTNIAVGSAQEVKSMFFLALNLGYIEQSQFLSISEELRKTLETTQGFRRYLNSDGVRNYKR